MRYIPRQFIRYGETSNAKSKKILLALLIYSFSRIAFATNHEISIGKEKGDLSNIVAENDFNFNKLNQRGYSASKIEVAILDDLELDKKHKITCHSIMLGN